MSRILVGVCATADPGSGTTSGALVLLAQIGERIFLDALFGLNEASCGEIVLLNGQYGSEVYFLNLGNC
jgi:hypothetical protein